MPQGGCNVPAMHQHQMTNTLREHIGKICHVYLDDITIWQQTMEEHEQNHNTILKAPQNASIYCNQVKPNLFATELCFLGDIILGTGIKPDPHKTDHIASYNSHQCQGFLGLTRYIATFLPALTKYTSVLTPLMTKECDWVFLTWTAEHQTAFKSIKHLVLGTNLHISISISISISINCSRALAITD